MEKRRRLGCKLLGRLKEENEEIVKGVDLAVAKGVDSIFAWPYRAGSSVY